MKTALIIGASSGIGMATAKILRDEDCTVYNASRTNCTISQVKNINVDVCNTEEIFRAIDTVVEECGGIDYLVYSAGYSMAAPIEYSKAEDYKYLFEVNFFGATAAVKAVIPKMRFSGGGRIVLISSIGGILPIAYDAYYSASKAALDMFAKSADSELKVHNIRVSCVQPGGTRTRFTFKRNVYHNDAIGDYSESLDIAVANLAKTEQGGMAPNDVAKTIIKVLKSNNPQRLVASGFMNKSIKLAQKILPDNMSLYLNNKQYED